MAVVSRIIPAHAGFTRALLLKGRVGHGSSPHTRGLRRLVSSTIRTSRIIPAHAGFTHHPTGPDDHHRDHPRTRGVYVGGLAGVLDDDGSSPHTRGLLSGHLPPENKERIIPAHAGFTPVVYDDKLRVADHPRTRGVYVTAGMSPGSVAGSSPHTRGLRCNSNRSNSVVRIIPAHAGFTSICLRSVSR